MAVNLCSIGETATMEDLFAWLDVVDENLRERFAKVQECVRQQLDDMHSILNLLV